MSVCVCVFLDGRISVYIPAVVGVLGAALSRALGTICSWGDALQLGARSVLLQSAPGNTLLAMQTGKLLIPFGAGWGHSSSIVS